MIASVHLADVGWRSTFGMLRRHPRPESVAGLRGAEMAIAAPLSGSPLPSLDLGRVALIAFWDDDDAVDRFLSRHPIAERLAGGWHARLEPLRAFGSWPGLPADLPRNRTVEHDGPAAVITLGRLRLSQAVRFLRASNKAETGVLDAPGLTWATGLARPPVVATCSLWESWHDLSNYAYGDSARPHPSAITADRAKPFHHQSAFIRFRPYESRGHLAGRNPLAETWMAPA
jgi:hypothetical protein